MAQGVFAITEQRDGELRKVSFEVVSEGRRIADGLGADLTAVVLGSGVEGLAEELKKYGPDKILVADDAALADYTTDAYTNVLTELIQAADSAVVITGASAQGKDLSGRLAAKLDAGVAMDCTAIKLDDGNFYEFGYYEYVGNDFEGDMEKLAAEPRNIEWLKVCDPMQVPLEGYESWAEMELVYYNP